MSYCKGCILYQQVRRGYYRCTNCPSMRKRKPAAWRKVEWCKANRIRDRKR